jgi:hypothetical protein
MLLSLSVVLHGSRSLTPHWRTPSLYPCDSVGRQPSGIRSAALSGQWHCSSLCQMPLRQPGNIPATICNIIPVCEWKSLGLFSPKLPSEHYHNDYHQNNTPDTYIIKPFHLFSSLFYLLIFHKKNYYICYYPSHTKPNSKTQKPFHVSPPLLIYLVYHKDYTLSSVFL